jgi:DNA topoisomerase VI subunit B
VQTVYARRSDRVPDPTREVKHHPSSVNHLIVQQLLEHTKAKTLLQFLSSELASVDKCVPALRCTALHA